MHLTIDQALKQALEAQRSGKFPDAERLYRAILQIQPKHPEANHNLGILAVGEGKPEAALPHLKAALKSNPKQGQFWISYIHALIKAKRLPEATTALMKLKRLGLAGTSFTAEAHANLGVVLQGLGRLTEAEASYREAVRLKPDYAEAHSNLGDALQGLGRLTEAEASYQEAIRLKAEAHSNLGNALHGLGRLTEAEASYREAIRLKPDYAEAHSNLGSALRGLGRLTEAEACCREAIRLKPDFPNAYCGLGALLTDLGRLTEAEVSFRKAILLNPDHAVAHSNLGSTLQGLGRQTEAEASCREAIRLKPDHIEAHNNLLFSLNSFASLSAEAALLEAKRYGSIVSARAEPKFASWRTSSEPSKLRVGFVSGDLRNHPVGYFLEGLLQHIDPNQFDLYAFPTVSTSDDLTIRIKPLFQEWIPIFGKGDLEAAKMIHQQGIHVLIDLSGHTAHNRLPVFSFKPAPVQVSWLGYFATTGLPEMGYFLGDPYSSPKSEQHHFSETIWNLPETLLCLTPPCQQIPILPLPALANGHVTFGSFVRVSKIGDGAVKLWATILQHTPNAKLFIKSMQLEDGKVVAEMQSRFASHGIPGDRLIFEGRLSRAEYWEAYNRVDVVLDTFPYPGVTTSFEAMWMGVPVLTLKGNRFLSHLGESIAHNSGQANWIANDLEEYLDKAVACASDLQGLANVRKALRGRVLRSPLFDEGRFAKNYGEALWGMFRRYSEHAS